MLFVSPKGDLIPPGDTVILRLGVTMEENNVLGNEKQNYAQERMVLEGALVDTEQKRLQLLYVLLFCLKEL